ncbi:MAG: hypothetical protein RMI91_08520 [Gemmatales bacterium]|nr:hypothetical protein [Gemmatales bacterium]MDW7994684.1 hypothetical protein [Gemmatales bacterium]
MRRWLRRLIGWLMRDWLSHPLATLGLGATPAVRNLRISWKKNGLEIHELPILDCADAITLRAELRYGATKAARRCDLTLHTARRSYPADSLIEDGLANGQGLHRAEFHIEPLPASDILELRWQGQLLQQISVPVLSLRQFVDQFQVVQPTLFLVLRGRSGEEGPLDYTVPGTKFFRKQGRCVLASAYLRSPTPLVALLDCHPTVLFQEEASGQAWEVPLRLTAEQLCAREALVTVQCPVRLRRLSRWKVEWRLFSSTTKARCQLEVLAMRSVHRQIVLLETYFVVQEDKTSQVKVEKRLPKNLPLGRVAPCFVLCTREPGLAFLADLEVYATCRDGSKPRLLASQEVLLTDSPSPYVPGTLAANDLRHVLAFELRCGGRLIGHLPLSPVPTARINAEGAFSGAPQDLAWSPALDEELRERLNRLMEQP